MALITSGGGFINQVVTFNPVPNFGEYQRGSQHKDHQLVWQQFLDYFIVHAANADYAPTRWPESPRVRVKIRSGSSSWTASTPSPETTCSSPSYGTGPDGRPSGIHGTPSTRGMYKTPYTVHRPHTVHIPSPRN